MDISSTVEIAVAIVASLSTTLGAITASGLSEKITRIFTFKDLAPEHGIKKIEIKLGPQGDDGEIAKYFPVLTPRIDAAKAQVTIRLEDARNIRARQKRLAKWGKLSANSLTFGQYIIGGMMTTAFVQKSLSANIIGIFGVLVLLSSLLKQHYNPEIAAQNALQRASQLEVLIRQSEDRIVVIDAKRDPDTDDPEPLLELLERISGEISRITVLPVDAPTPRSSAQRRGR